MKYFILQCGPFSFLILPAELAENTSMKQIQLFKLHHFTHTHTHTIHLPQLRPADGFRTQCCPNQNVCQRVVQSMVKI